MEPLYRNAWWRNARWPLIAVRAWRAAGRVLRDEQPAIVIGTGGYAAGPVVWRAQNARIPTALQEQNAFPGLTQRLLARRAQQVHLGFPEARLRLSPGSHTQVFVFGNPITPPGRVDRAAARAELGLTAERRTVLVFGGSQGARECRRERIAARARVHARGLREDRRRAGARRQTAGRVGPKCPGKGSPECRPNHHGKGFRAFASCVDFVY